MPEQSSKYYDDAFTRETFRNGEPNHYLGSWGKSPFAELWDQIDERIPIYSHIVDIGCGPGQFAEMLYDYSETETYTGIDFSKAAIEAAKKRLDGASGFTFIHNGAHAVRYELLPCDCYVLSEVLEHLAEDHALIKKLLPETRIIITVPSYNDLGHVRYFSEVSEVAKRYEGVIDVEEVAKIGRHFILTGTTKAK